MIYHVEETEEVLAELSALPAEALTAYLELRTTLELTPWSGNQYNPDNPAGANMRTQPFGSGHGLAIYVIIEHPELDEHRVVITRTTWI
ncbi:hypothetical protein [Actinocorallia longicatena]|uniref:Uncharacterized protein n=1 Tax=Actinocorallia longicatena TaxID=111803 RepID=A0ABP6QA16_9ACTN